MKKLIFRSFSQSTANLKFLLNKTNLYDSTYFDPKDVKEYEKMELEFKDLDLAEKLKPISEYFPKTNVFEGESPLQSGEIKEDYFRDNLHKILETNDPKVFESLRAYANHVLETTYGKIVFLRGIIEFSNVCEKNCNYCGIRGGKEDVKRYSMTREEIIEYGMSCYEAKYGTLMMQGGEISSDKHIDYLCGILEELGEKTNHELCLSLSVGELTKEQYQKLYDAGATRYLLRVESSNPELYKKMHPDDGNHLWERRNQCIDDMKEIGWYVGTGGLINVPDQTTDDLVSDLLFLAEKKIDMIGMGPYLTQNDTPMADQWEEENGDIDIDVYKKKLMYICLKMLSLARIINFASNISATTALQLLDPKARELGLLSGANVVMPIITPGEYRENYKLYERKQTVDNIKQRDALFESILKSGKELALDGGFGNPKTKKLYKELDL